MEGAVRTRAVGGFLRWHRQAWLLYGGLAVCTAISACKAPPLVEGTVPPSTIVSDLDWGAYTLGAGDVVSVVVFRHPEFSTPERGERIDGVGSVSLPLVGPVSVGGATTDEARTVIAERLAEYLVDPAVSVSVVSYGARRIYVFGEVGSPGAFPLDRPINALQALSLGGGFREGADREKVALLRASNDDLEVHYFNAATPGRDGLVAVQPGDFLFVRQTGAGTFREQVVPYAATLAPIIGSLTNLLVISDALDD